MDGSGLAFLLDPPFVSGPNAAPDCGILYFEDFDSESPVTPEKPAEAAPTELPPTPTSEDVEAARRQGFEEGTRAALGDARLVQDQVRAAALQSLSDALASARGTLERVAGHHAETSARAILAVLQAAIPASMARHARCELDAVIRALSPGLSCQPELRVRAHPEIADHVRETLVQTLPPESVLLRVTADPALAVGDVQLTWQDGGARRDCRSIWNAVRHALSALELPALEEVCRGH